MATQPTFGKTKTTQQQNQAAQSQFHNPNATTEEIASRANHQVFLKKRAEDLAELANMPQLARAKNAAEIVFFDDYEITTGLLGNIDEELPFEVNNKLNKLINKEDEEKKANDNDNKPKKPKASGVEVFAKPINSADPEVGWINWKISTSQGPVEFVQVKDKYDPPNGWTNQVQLKNVNMPIQKINQGTIHISMNKNNQDGHYGIAIATDMYNTFTLDVWTTEKKRKTAIITNMKINKTTFYFSLIKDDKNNYRVHNDNKGGRINSKSLEKMSMNDFILPDGMNLQTIKNKLGAKPGQEVYVTPVDTLKFVDEKTLDKLKTVVKSDTVFYTPQSN